MGISAQKGLFLLFLGHKFHTWLEAQAFFFRLPFIALRASCHDPLKVFCFRVCGPLSNSPQNGSLHNLKKSAQNAAEKRDSISFFTSSFHSRSWNITATGLRALSCLSIFEKSCNGIIDLVLFFWVSVNLFTFCMLFLRFSGCVFCCCGMFLLANVGCWFLFALVQIAGCTLHETSSSHLNNWHLKMKGSSSNHQFSRLSCYFQGGYIDFPWQLGHSDSVSCTFSFSVIFSHKAGDPFIRFITACILSAIGYSG